ncbi:MAG TPA: alpha/beta fold hydrolase [Oligoflexus sp.]|uniref:lipase family alpha/beta hydrolase n=1 Tax=Oligoflexus sp. TaxID=1971216 RepID=UPI002D7FC008|nr:alpha/beta fold hydrolase [Oligoflexus sp.]HET9240172.1 alpha/beta fold hydrolase [Oligoflexus sp.]
MSGLSTTGFDVKAWLKTMICSLFTLVVATASAHAGSDNYAKTRYPIVMVPGAFAFDNVLGVVDYWYGITDELRRQGAEVYVTNLSSSASNVRRGEELLEDIRQIRALTGASRVNLIAHSQGGPAARYVASLKPEWIESVNCVTCMNEGTEFADNLYAFLNKHILLKWVANVTLSTVFSALDIFSTSSKDGSYNSAYRGVQIAEDLVQAAGTKALDKFNAQFPEALSEMNCELQEKGKLYKGISGPALVNNVSYFSWGGVDVVTNRVDPLDSVLVPVVKIFFPSNARIWDGLVRSCGHPLGQLTEGFYPLNHFDAINQAFGLVRSGIDIPTLYVQNANRLQKAGH